MASRKGVRTRPLAPRRTTLGSRAAVAEAGAASGPPNSPRCSMTRQRVARSFRYSKPSRRARIGACSCTASGQRQRPRCISPGMMLALAAGRGAIVLVPEIALTPQYPPLCGRFPGLIAVVHSALTDAERAGRSGGAFAAASTR